MKKRELEKLQRQFQGNTRTDAEALRARISTDLNVVKDAYDTGSIALTELDKQLANIAFSDAPVKELAMLSRAYADIAKTLIALRTEGRTTIAEAVAAQAVEHAAEQAPAVDPPPPLGAAARRGTTEPPKISSPNSSPVTPTPTISIGDAFEAVDSTED